MEEGGSEGKWERGGEGVEVMLLFWWVVVGRIRGGFHNAIRRLSRTLRTSGRVGGNIPNNWRSNSFKTNTLK